MRSYLTQAALWIIGPALGTLVIVIVTTAAYNHQPVLSGHATQAPDSACVTSPDEFFNDCAVLDTTQVNDLRTQHGNTDLEVK